VGAAQSRATPTAAVLPLSIGHAPALRPALETLAWLIGLLLVFIPLAVRAFRRA
jgi:hypothetical protein